MAQNKAFVRYANNKAVPGSLIVRKKAPKVGVWKEIDYDLCCDTGCVSLYAVAVVGPNTNSLDTARAIYSDRDLQNIPEQCGVIPNPSLAIGAKLCMDNLGTIPVANGEWRTINENLQVVYVVTDGIITNVFCL